MQLEEQDPLGARSGAGRIDYVTEEQNGSTGPNLDADECLLSYFHNWNFT
jgi:hypothetical protein